MKKLVFFFYLFLLLSHVLRAQQDSTAVKYDTAPLKVKEIHSDDLHKFTEDEDFNYEVAKTEDNWWNNFKTWLANSFLRFFEWLFGVEKASGFLALFFRLIPYVLLGILLYILIKFFIGANARSLLQANKSKGVVSLSEEEHIIKNEDIALLIKEALKVSDYRLAVRYYYLYILQLMTEKELIAWQLQKTNDDYIEEIKQAELQAPFKDLTYLYDYIWYGNFPIDHTSYLSAEKKFLSLKKNVETNG